MRYVSFELKKMIYIRYYMGRKCGICCTVGDQIQIISPFEFESEGKTVLEWIFYSCSKLFLWDLL